MEKLLKDKEDLLAKLDSAEKELETKKQQNHEYKRSLSLASALEEDYVLEIKALQSNNKVSKLKNILHQLEEQFSNKKYLINHPELQQKKEKIEFLQKRIQELKVTKSAAKVKVIETKKILEANEAVLIQNKVLKGEVKTLENKFQELQKDVDNMQVENNSIQEIFNASKKTVLELTQILDSKSQVLQTLTDKICKVQEELTLMEQELEAAKCKPLDSDKRGNSLFAEVDDSRVKLQQQVRQLEHSYESAKHDLQKKLQLKAVLIKQTVKLSEELNGIESSEDQNKAVQDYVADTERLEMAIEKYKIQLLDPTRFTGHNIHDCKIEFANCRINRLWKELCTARDELNEYSKELLKTSYKLLATNKEKLDQKLIALKLKVQIEQMQNSILEMQFQKKPNDSEKMAVQPKIISSKAVVNSSFPKETNCSFDINLLRRRTSNLPFIEEEQLNSLSNTIEIPDKDMSFDLKIMQPKAHSKDIPDKQMSPKQNVAQPATQLNDKSEATVMPNKQMSPKQNVVQPTAQLNDRSDTTDIPDKQMSPKQSVVQPATQLHDKSDATVMPNKQMSPKQNIFQATAQLHDISDSIDNYNNQMIPKPNVVQLTAQLNDENDTTDISNKQISLKQNGAQPTALQEFPDKHRFIDKQDSVVQWVEHSKSTALEESESFETVENCISDDSYLICSFNNLQIDKNKLPGTIIKTDLTLTNSDNRTSVGTFGGEQSFSSGFDTETNMLQLQLDKPSSIEDDQLLVSPSNLNYEFQNFVNSHNETERLDYNSIMKNNIGNISIQTISSTVTESDVIQSVSSNLETVGDSTHYVNDINGRANDNEVAESDTESEECFNKSQEPEKSDEKLQDTDVVLDEVNISCITINSSSSDNEEATGIDLGQDIGEQQEPDESVAVPSFPHRDSFIVDSNWKEHRKITSLSTELHSLKLNNKENSLPSKFCTPANQKHFQLLHGTNRKPLSERDMSAKNGTGKASAEKRWRY